MGDVTRFAVCLTDDCSVFHAGETLTGVILLDVEKKRTNIRAIHLEIKGEAKVRFTTTDNVYGRTTHTVTNRHLAVESLLHYESLVCGRETLEPGLHRFPFSCLLAPDLPSSYQDRIGSVRYAIEANLQGPHGPWPVQKNFSVLALGDGTPRVTVQRSTEKSTALNCCLYNLNVSASFATDQSEYAPGEVIRCFAQVENDSSLSRACTVLLRKYMVYRAPSKTTREKYTIAQLDLGEVTAGGSGLWQGEQLTVPRLPPTGMQGCSVMDVRYRIKLTVRSEGFSCFNLSLPLDIVIGCIPLDNGAMTSPASRDQNVFISMSDDIPDKQPSPRKPDTIVETPPRHPLPSVVETPPRHPLPSVVETPPRNPLPPVVETPPRRPLPSAVETPPCNPLPPVVETPPRHPLPSVVETPLRHPLPSVVETPSRNPLPPVVETPLRHPLPPVVETPSRNPLPPVVETPLRHPLPPVVETPSRNPLPPVVETPPRHPLPAEEKTRQTSVSSWI